MAFNKKTYLPFLAHPELILHPTVEERYKLCDHKLRYGDTQYIVVQQRE